MALFTLEKCSSDAAAIFEFTNASTTSNTGYKIIWGDGAPDSVFSTFTIISHSYNIGTYPLKFIVTGNGCTDTATYYIYVGSNPAVGLGNPGNTTICTGVSLTFPITGTSTNTPGTIYTVTFNDGSAPVTYTHPVPSDVTHNFANGSFLPSAKMYLDLCVKSIQLIRDLNPVIWFIENPRGRIVEVPEYRKLMQEQNVYLHLMTYSSYGSHSTKPTYLLTNSSFVPRSCMPYGRGHKSSVLVNNLTAVQRSSMPEALCMDVANFCKQKLSWA